MNILCRYSTLRCKFFSASANPIVKKGRRSMNRVMHHVAVRIVSALMMSMYNLATSGDVFSHIASLGPSGTKNKAIIVPQTMKNSPILQTIFQVVRRPEIILDFIMVSFCSFCSCISMNERSCQHVILQGSTSDLLDIPL